MSLCQTVKENENLKSSTLLSAECAESVCSRHVSGILIFAEVPDLSLEHFEENAEILRSKIKKNTTSLFQR